MQLVKSLSRKYRRYYQGGTYYVGVLTMLGYLLCWGTRGCAIFLGILFAQNLKVGYQFWRKIIKQGNILLRNRPNFFIESMM